MSASQEDIIDLLVSQHQQVRSLFDEFASAEGEQRRQLFDELVVLLAVHESVEEQLVHPLSLTHVVDGEEVVRARLEEEQQAKIDLAELYDLGVEHPDFDDKLLILRDAVVEHADLEEEEEFPELRETVPADRLLRLAEAMRAAQQSAPARPHPSVPAAATSTATAAETRLGPPMAVFDRVGAAVRDAARAAGDS